MKSCGPSPRRLTWAHECIAVARARLALCCAKQPTRESSGLVSCLRSSPTISPALDAPGRVAPPRNIPDMPASARLARDADCSPKELPNFGDRTLGGTEPVTDAPTQDDKSADCRHEPEAVLEWRPPILAMEMEAEPAEDRKSNEGRHHDLCSLDRAGRGCQRLFRTRAGNPGQYPRHRRSAVARRNRRASA